MSGFLSSQNFGDASRIRVALVPIGPVAPDILEKYAAVIRHYETIMLEEVTRNEASTQFPSLSWQHGKVRFTYELTTPEAVIASDWEGLQAHRKLLGVIGICHCPRWTNLSKSVELFTEISSKLPVLAQRCFAFEPLKDQEDISIQNFIMIPTGDERHLQFYVHRMLVDFTDSLLSQFEQWVDRSAQIPYVSTPLDSDSSADDVKSLKKRRNGRIKKCIGDYCLLAGAHADATANYKEALELSKSKDDALWHGAALEGLAEAKALEAWANGESFPLDDVITSTLDAVAHYTKRQADSLAAEVWLKIANAYSHQKNAIECLNSCMACYDSGSKLNAQDKINLFKACAYACASVGARRKEAFFMMSAARLYRDVFEYRSALTLSKDLLSRYRLDYEEDLVLGEDRKGVLQAPGSDIDGWPQLQASVLGDVISFSTSLQDPQTTAFFTLYLLRRLHGTVPPHIQLHYANELTKITKRSPDVDVDMVGLPRVARVTPNELPPHLRPSKPTAAPVDPSAASGGSPFIYSPFANRNKEKSAAPTWVCHEAVSVSVLMSNPLGIPVPLQNVSLSTSGIEFEAYPVAVTLAPFAQGQKVELYGKPLSPGTLRIRGLVIQAFNVTCEHPIGPTGTGITSSEFKAMLADENAVSEDGTREPPAEVPGAINKIKVIPPLTLLSISGDTLSQSSRTLFDGERQSLTLEFQNIGMHPIGYISIGVQERKETEGLAAKARNKERKHRPPVFSISDPNPYLPLQPGARFTLSVHMQADVSCQGADVTVEYGADVRADHCRLTELEFPMTVRTGLQVVNFDIVSSHSRFPGTSKSFHDNDSVSPDACFLVFEVLNSSDANFEVASYLDDVDYDPTHVRVKDEWAQDQSFWNSDFVPSSAAMAFGYDKQARQSSVPSNNSAIVEPATVRRFIVPIQRFAVSDVPRPSMTPKKQYIVPKENLSEAERLLRKQLKDYKQSIVNRVHLLWRSGHHTTGRLPIYGINLLPSMLVKVMPEPILFLFKLPTGVSRAEGEGASTSTSSSGDGSGDYSFRPSNVYHNIHEPTSIWVRVINNSKDAVTGTVRLQPFQETIGDNTRTNDLSSKIAWAGSLEQAITDLSPQSSVDLEFTVCFLTQGIYNFLFELENAETSSLYWGTRRPLELKAVSE